MVGLLVVAAGVVVADDEADEEDPELLVAEVVGVVAAPVAPDVAVFAVWPLTGVVWAEASEATTTPMPAVPTTAAMPTVAVVRRTRDRARSRARAAGWAMGWSGRGCRSMAWPFSGARVGMTGVGVIGVRVIGVGLRLGVDSLDSGA